MQSSLTSSLELVQFKNAEKNADICNLIPRTLDFFPHQRRTACKLRPPVPKFHSEAITDATKGGEGL